MPTQYQSDIRVLCSRISEHVGQQQINVQGWVRNIRNLGQIVFFDVRDRSGTVQCVLEKELVKIPLNLEFVVSVNGFAKHAPKAPDGHEISVTHVEILNKAESSLPFELNKKSLNVRLDTMLDHRVLSLRHAKVHATFAIQSVLAGAFREYLAKNGFTQIFTPKIVATGTEGGSNLFPIQYFEHQAYLAQSPQFYKQMMVGAGYERVFEIGPVYRAEEHNTSRHLNEYTSLDVETGFIRSEDELMDLEVDLLKYMLEQVASGCEAELDLLNIELPVLADVPKIPVLEAQAILLRKYGKLSPEGDLDAEGERLICKYVADQGKPAFVFLTEYPVDIRPFYAMPTPHNPKLTASFDLIFNGLEITTGGQRIHEFGQLAASIQSRGLNPESFGGYMEMFRYGMPPHGGFAIGLERLTSRLLGQNNVREAAAFPRDRSRLTP